MLLTFDVGNTHVKIGAFDGPRLVAMWRLMTDVDGTADEYAVWIRALLHREGLAFDAFDGCIISSVVPPLTHALSSFGEHYLGRPPLIVSPALKLGLPIRYNPPTALGPDRLVAVVAGRHRYGAPVLVVTLGTATTFNVVAPDGAFVGGAIAPGVETAAEALHLATASLPLVDLVAPDLVIGRDTDTAVRAGVIYGYAGLVDGLARRLKAAVLAETPGADGSSFPVVATGGLAHVIAPVSATIDVVDEGLTLEGVRLIWEMNQ